MKDERIDRAIRNTLAEQNVRGRRQCPDDSLIAAYLDSQLRPEENAEFEAHAACCPACREILALSMRLGEDTDLRQPTTRGQEGRVFFHLAIPVSVLVLLVVVSGVGILYYRAFRNTSRTPAETQTAELRVPAKPREEVQLSQAPEMRVTEPPANPKQSTLKKESQSHTRALPATGISSATTEARKDEALAGNANPVLAEREKTDALVALQATRENLQAEPGAVSGPPMGAISPHSAPEPRFGALRVTASDRSPRAVAEARLQKAAALNETAAGSGGSAGKSGTEAVSSTATKKIGNRTFVRTADIWVDDECAKHPEVSVTELPADSEEYAEILNSYPELRGTRPAMIFWKGRKLLIR